MRLLAAWTVMLLLGMNESFVCCGEILTVSGEELAKKSPSPLFYRK